jgi:hypothetical protein
MSINSFEIVKTALGKTSIRDRSGEILHNPAGPWVESKLLYVQQSGFPTKIANGDSHPLVLLDVGLGAAFNVMATLEVFFEMQDQGIKTRPLRILSFENDLGLFDFALKNLEFFPEGLPYRHLLKDIRKGGRVEGPNFEWEILGDFLKSPSISNPNAEIVFYDAFSPKVNSEMWSLEAFRHVKKLMNPEGAVLVTYTNSTPSRVGMLMAGLFVGHGIASADKTETTMAATHGNLLVKPLSERWFQRWERSDRPLPLGLEIFSRENVLNALLGHPQFANSCKLNEERRE